MKESRGQRRIRKQATVPSIACYAHLLGYGAQKGQWNDWPNTGNAEGYVVEYGGMAGETMAVLSAAKTVAMSIPAKPIITVGVDDQFNDTAWDSWVPSSSPGSAQTMTGAWLQLTPVTQS